MSYVMKVMILKIWLARYSVNSNSDKFLKLNELIESHLRHHVIAEQTEINEHELAEFLKLLKRYG